MHKHTYSIFSILLLTLLIGAFLAACGSSNTTPAPSSGGATDGLGLMQERCTVCHSTDRITSAQKTLDEWTTTVGRMIGKGAQLDAQEKQTLLDYLAANYK